MRIYLNGSKRVSSLGTPVFDLMSGTDAIKLNARLSSGSGSGDMRLLVPEAAFAGANGSSFLYLYSKFGGLAGAGANGGFEEWSVGPATPPPPALGSISGTAFLDSNGNGTSDAGEGFGNLLMTLVGSDAQGNPVNLSVLTNADGSFTFSNLNEGTYSLIESDATFDSIDTTAGTAGGTDDSANDQITDITLGNGQNASGYFFNVVFVE